MKSFSAHVQKASASSLPLGRAAPQDCFQGARNLVPSTAPGFLGSRSGLEAILPLRSSGRARLPVMQAIAVAPDLALHDVRYVDGETVGATPKFRQICMSSSLKVPFNNTLPLPKLGKDVQEGLDAVGRTAAAMRQKKAVVKVVGVGYGGSKAVEAMLQKTGLEAAEFFLVAADSESLPEPSSRLPESHKIVLGLDKLMGAQLKSDIDLEEELEAQLDGADLVVVVAGMGGNTGGVPPVVAKVARRIGALTVGLMTKPFAFEGPRRSSLAEKHVAMMKKRTDTLIVVPCDQLLEGKDPNFGVRDAFKLVDSVLRQGVKGLTDMVTGSGLVDANLSEVQTLLTDAGLASMGVGSAAGPGRASAAAQAALASSSLSKGLQSAQGVVYSMSGDPSLSLYEVAEISEIVQAHVGGFAKANVLFAASTDEHMQGRVQVTVIAAGLPEARLLPAEKGRQMARATMVVGSSRRSSSIMWSTR